MTVIVENTLSLGLIGNWTIISLMHRGEMPDLASLNLRLCISILLHRPLETPTGLTSSLCNIHKDSTDVDARSSDLEFLHECWD